MNAAMSPKRRQRNVAEQNALLEARLLAEASFWREKDLPVALYEYGRANGIRWDAAIVLRLELNFPGMPEIWGELITDTERFIAFELETDETHQILRRVEAWRDITDEQNFVEHNPGFGKGFGAIAMRVHRELCGLRGSEHESPAELR